MEASYKAAAAALWGRRDARSTLARPELRLCLFAAVIAQDHPARLGWEGEQGTEGTQGHVCHSPQGLMEPLTSLEQTKHILFLSEWAASTEALGWVRLCQTLGNLKLCSGGLSDCKWLLLSKRGISQKPVSCLIARRNISIIIKRKGIHSSILKCIMSKIVPSRHFWQTQ